MHIFDKMPTARKRASGDASLDEPEPSRPPSTLDQIRNMWQFANVVQFIMLFGKALKLDDNLDIEVSCLATHRSPETFALMKLASARILKRTA